MIKIYYNSERGIKKKSWDAKNIGPKPRILVISDINFINQWDLITSLNIIGNTTYSNPIKDNEIYKVSNFILV